MAKISGKGSRRSNGSAKETSNSIIAVPQQPEPTFKDFLKLPPELRTLVYTEHILSFYGDVHICLPGTRAFMKKYGVQWKRKIKYPLALLHASTLLRKEYMPIIRSHAKINIVSRDLLEFERDFIRPQSSTSQPPLDTLFHPSAENPVYLHIELPLLDRMVDMLSFLSFHNRYPEYTTSISTRLLNCKNPQVDLGRLFSKHRRKYRRLRTLPLCVVNAASKLLEDTEWRDTLSQGGLSKIRGSLSPNITSPWGAEIEWSMSMMGEGAKFIFGELPL